MSRICHLFTGEAVRTDLDWCLAMMGIAYWTFQCDRSKGLTACQLTKPRPGQRKLLGVAVMGRGVIEVDG